MRSLIPMTSLSRENLTSLVSEIEVDAVLRESQVSLEGILCRHGSDLGCGELLSPLSSTGSIRRDVILPGVAEIALAPRLIIGNKQAVNIKEDAVS